MCLCVSLLCARSLRVRACVCACAHVCVRADANLFGDFMVPFGTAAIETDGWGAGVGDARLADSFTQQADGSVIFRDESVCAGESDGVAVILDDAAVCAAAAAAGAAPAEAAAAEEEED